MAGPGGPVNDLIMRLMAEAGHVLGARPSPELREHVLRRTMGLSQPDLNQNVLPGPGSAPPISKDPWFDQASLGPEIYIWAKKDGKTTRLAGPFPNEEAAERELLNLEQHLSGDMTLEIGPQVP